MRNSTPIDLLQVAPDVYVSSLGHSVRRETLPPDPENHRGPVNGQWVLRAPDGSFVDCDENRNDLFERSNMRVARALDAQRLRPTKLCPIGVAEVWALSKRRRGLGGPPQPFRYAADGITCDALLRAADEESNGQLEIHARKAFVTTINGQWWIVSRCPVTLSDPQGRLSAFKNSRVDLMLAMRDLMSALLAVSPGHPEVARHQRLLLDYGLPNDQDHQPG